MGCKKENGKVNCGVRLNVYKLHSGDMPRPERGEVGHATEYDNAQQCGQGKGQMSREKT